MSLDTLAIDFGTSNSAAAVLEDGKVRRLAIETEAETIPTAIFFPTDKGAMRIGAAAALALISGEEGRYMRALKSGAWHLLVPRTAGDRGQASDVGRYFVTGFLIEVKGRARDRLGPASSPASCPGALYTFTPPT